MATQPDHSRLGELSPSHCGDAGVSESGDGSVSLSLAMGQTSASEKVGSLDYAAVLAPAGTAPTFLRGSHHTAR